jgi:hypothetical protein
MDFTAGTHAGDAGALECNHKRRNEAMNRIKLTYILFSLAVIAALVIAAVPAPVFALSGAPAVSASSNAQLTAGVPTTGSVLICRSVGFWRFGHWVVIRLCHRGPNPA